MIEKIKKNKYIPYIIIVFVAIIICIPLFTMNLSEYNEFRIHIVRITAIKEVIKDGIFPPNINAKYMCGFGYALNIFYGVLTTFVPILISLLTSSTAIALKLFTLITVILSGFTMYNLIRKITSKRLPALIGALVYISAPYKFTDIYSRNAVGEYTAFIFIPMIFQGLYEILNIKEEKKTRDYLLIIGTAGLILTHTITTIYTAIFALLYLIFNIKKIKSKFVVKKLAIDILWILLITAFYTIPLIEHKAYGNYSIYDAESMGTTVQDVYQNTNKVSDWFKCELSQDELVFSFGIVIIFLMAITVVCYKQTDKKYKEEYIEYGILSIISLYMCTKAFPWIILPQFLGVTQFAWRLNGFFIFFISLICGINAMILSDKLYRIKKVIISIIILTIVALAAFRGLNYVSKYDYEKDKNYEENLLNYETIGPYQVNREYLPLNVSNNMKYLIQRQSKTYVLNGEATITNENKDKLKDSLEISDVQNATIELPFIYYHGYKVEQNGKKINTYESSNGFLCIDVKENGRLTVQYQGTASEKVGYIISAFSVIALLIQKKSKK